MTTAIKKPHYRMTIIPDDNWLPLPDFVHNSWPIDWYDTNLRVTWRGQFCDNILDCTITAVGYQTVS